MSVARPRPTKVITTYSITIPANLSRYSPEVVGVVIQTEHNSLRVLDQNGFLRLVDACQISMRRETRRLVAIDSEGHEIRINDNMKEIQGEFREGRVLHVHQSHYAFLHNRGVLESGGVFVTRARLLVSMSPRVSFPESWCKVPISSRVLSTAYPNAGGATPARTSRLTYSSTPAASPYVGSSTPAWNTSLQTPVGSPRAESLPDYSAFRGESTECMDLPEDDSDPYGKSGILEL